MKKLVLALLLLALLTPAAGLADDVPDRPAFLDGYTDYYEYDGWYLACLDTSPSLDGDAVKNGSTHWVLLDGEGNLLQDGLKYRTADDYRRPFDGWQDGCPLAPLRVGDKWGFIDREGTMVVAPAYDYAERFIDGLSRIGVAYDSVTDGSGYTQRWLHYGMIDTAGQVVYEPIYDGVDNSGWSYTADSGLVTLEQAGKYALGTNRGELLTEFAYDALIVDFQSDIPIRAQQGGRWGFLNRDGTTMVEAKYDEVDDFSEGLAAVREADKKWGYIDTEGKTAIKAAYDAAAAFSEGLAAVKQGGKWGYVKTDGKWAVKPKFAEATAFSPSGYAVVELKNGKNGVIDRKGKVLLESKHDMAVSDDDGIVTVENYDSDEPEFYDLSSGEAKPATILTASMDLTDYMPFTGKKVAKLSGKPTLAHRVSEDHDLPHLDGATGMFPVYAAYVEALYPDKTRYTAWDPEAPEFSPLVTCTKTNVAYERLIDGEADIIFVAQPSDEELQMAADRGVEMELLPIGKEAFVFVVNRKNPIEGLELNEIRWIYAGLIKDWSEVGVDGLGPIIPYQRPKNSGSQTALEALMGDMPLMEAPQEIVAWDMGDILETVEYRNLPNALGYSFRFFCTEMMKSDVKLLAIDGVAPTVENIRNESYPLTSTLYAIRLKSNTENPNTNALWEWLQGPQAAELLEKAGYVANELSTEN